MKTGIVHKNVSFFKVMNSVVLHNKLGTIIHLRTPSTHKYIGIIKSGMIITNQNTLK